MITWEREREKGFPNPLSLQITLQMINNIFLDISYLINIRIIILNYKWYIIFCLCLCNLLNIVLQKGLIYLVNIEKWNQLK